MVPGWDTFASHQYHTSMRTVRHTLPAMLFLLGLSASAQVNSTVRARTDARVSKASTTLTSDVRALNDADVFRYRPKRS